MSRKYLICLTNPERLLLMRNKKALLYSKAPFYIYNTVIFSRYIF